MSASEDDHNPVVQLWDLRNANSPVKELSGHTKGILDLDWCSRDASLLLSSGKDNRTLVWDPLVEEGPQSIVAELPASQNWVFEVAWCPRNPGACRRGGKGLSVVIFLAPLAQCAATHFSFPPQASFHRHPLTVRSACTPFSRAHRYAFIMSLST